MKKFFAPSKNSRTDGKTENAASENEFKSTEPISHGVSFGVVYANDLAAPEIGKDAPDFAVGSIIVREKNSAADSQTPETIIAMVKRDKNFSPQTGDWEFYVFNGSDLKMKSRETTGDCAACHIQATKSDWIFRDYLKK